MTLLTAIGQRAHQKELRLGAEIKPLPLATIPEARRLLAANEDKILALIDSGELEFAWHIESPASARKEIRIWAPCLDAYGQGKPIEAVLSTSPRELNEDYVLTLILPRKDTLSAPELAGLLNSSSTHVLDLFREGCLCTTPSSIVRRGPNGSPQIIRVSVEQFLKSRRLL